MKKVAIFIDWDNFRQELDAVSKHVKVSLNDFDYNNMKNILDIIKNFLNKNEELYRIFIYTAPPLSSQDIQKELERRVKKGFITEETKLNFEKNQNLNKEKFENIYKKAKKFIDNIAQEEYIALRKGILKIGKVSENGELTINQKQVDMLIGLDIAQLSYENRVDKIIVLSKDTDMKPAIKVARVNGIHTVIACFEEYPAGIPVELKEHADTIRKKSFIKFIEAKRTIKKIKENKNV